MGRALAIAIVLVAGTTIVRAQTADEAPPEALSDDDDGTPPGGSATPARLSSTPAVTQRLAAVDLQGDLHENRERLLRFLGLVAGAPFGQEDQTRLDTELRALGYRQLDTKVERLGGGLVRLHLRIEPMRIVRNVVVKHSWPLFDDEIVRHLSLRQGQTLPADTELRQRLAEEAEAVRKYLFNEGYFEASATVEPHVALVGTPRRPRPQWVDLVVTVNLGPSYRLDDVKPTYDHEDGAKHLPKSQLYDYFHHWLRFKVSQMRDDARKAEKALRDAGFPAARVVPDFDFARDADRKRHSITLPIRVSAKRKVEVKFIGNRAVSAKDLRDQLTIFTAGAFDDVELAESARALQREYQKRGYFEARVTFRRALKRGPVDSGTGKARDEVEEVTFTIDEGPELKVQRVEIVSDTPQPLTFAVEDLRNKASLETKPFPPLGSIGLGEGGYVTQLQLSQDAERLVNLYKSRGFPAVKVRYEVARDPAAFDALGVFGAEVTGGGGGHDLYVRFFVDEGRREIVDHLEISFIGPHVRDEIDVLKAVQLGAGQPYTDAAVADDQQHIKDLYKTSGHPLVVIDPTSSSWNAAHDRVVLRYVINEGPEIRFGEILIRGNFKTHASTIRRDLPFKVGDLYDLTKVEAAERNLQTHLIFNSARIMPAIDPTSGIAPVLVTVQERYLEAYGSVTFALGAASDRLPDYVYVSAAYQWNNVLGYGSQLELKGDLAILALLLGNPITMGASLRYTDTRAFGPGWRFDLFASVRNEVTNRFGEIRNYGGSTGITRNIITAPNGSAVLSTYLRADINLYNLNVSYLRLLGINDTSSVQDSTLIIKGVFGIDWDRRVGADGLPNPLAAVKGWRLSGAVAYAPIANGNPFFIFEGQAVGILPIRIRDHEFSLSGNLRYDHGLPTDQPALPLVQRFYAGGDTTGRGYDTDTLKSEIVRTQVSPLPGVVGYRVVPEGGNIRMLNTIDFQFPIAKTFLGLPLSWAGAVFWDMGAVFNRWDLIKTSDVKHSIGVSLLRLLTPVGPLSIEYAYPLTPTLAEERWKTSPWYSHFPGRIHFNWGIPLSRL